MNEKHLLKAREAILRRIRLTNVGPEDTMNIHLFIEELTDFRNGYFQTAMDGLIADGYLEWAAATPRFIRLTGAGYEEANR